MQGAWHSFIDAKCRRCFDRLDVAGSIREPLGQRKGIKIHQGAITHDICCFSIVSKETNRGEFIGRLINLYLPYFDNILEIRYSFLASVSDFLS